MKKFLTANWPLLVLLVLAVATRFWNLGYPAEVVFDEVHFGKFVSAYFTHQYYFDIHPPLGKLMIFVFSRIFGYAGGFPFLVIGEPHDSQMLLVLRFLPALFGTLLIPLIYLLSRVLGLSRKAAFLAGLMIVFENAILVEAKFILLDMFLIFFGFAAVFFFALSRKASGYKQLLFLVLAAIFSGLSMSIKWIGLAFWAMICLFVLIDSFKKFNLKRFAAKAAILGLIPLAIYVLAFVPHFKLLYKSGPGDAFMSQDFQKTLQGNSLFSGTQSRSFFKNFAELNVQMYTSSANLKSTHPDGSTWSDWLFMRRPIWYWDRDLQTNIYLVGNPFIWYAVSPAILLVLLNLIFDWPDIFKQKTEKRSWLWFLICGYFISLLPFALMSRVVFLYHYLTPLIFGIIILAFFFDETLLVPQTAEEKAYKIKKLQEKGVVLPVKRNFLGFGSWGRLLFFFGVIVLLYLAFWFVSPLSYGLPISDKMAPTYSSLLRFLGKSY